MKTNVLTKVKFAAKISRMGDRKIIIIPKDYYEDVEDFRKQVMITIDDEL